MWTHKEGFMWPKDLPKRFPTTRILVFGYNSIFDTSKGENFIRITSIATELLHELKARRSTPQEEKRPIIMIGHSLGGLVIEKALILSEEDRIHDVKVIASSTACVMLYGTPNAGTLVTEMNRVQIVKSIAKLAGMAVPQQLERELELHSTELLDISSKFRDLDICQEQNVPIYTFYEILSQGQVMGRVKGRVRVVDEFSSKVGARREVSRPVNADHQNMVKFWGKKDKNYENARDIIQAVINSLDKGVQQAAPSTMALARKDPQAAYFAKQLNTLRLHHWGHLHAERYEIIHEEFAPSHNGQDSSANWSGGTYKLRGAADDQATVQLTIDWKAWEGDPCQPTIAWTIETRQSLYYPGVHRGSILFTGLQEWVMRGVKPLTGVKVRWRSPIFSPFVMPSGGTCSDLMEGVDVVHDLAITTESLAIVLAFGPYENKARESFSPDEGKEVTKYFREVKEEQYMRSSSFFSRAYNESVLDEGEDGEFVTERVAEESRQTSVQAITDLLDFYLKDWQHGPDSSEWNFRESFQTASSRRELAIEDRKWANKLVKACGLQFLQKALAVDDAG